MDIKQLILLAALLGGTPLSVFAATQQSVKVTVSMRNVPLKSIFNTIEGQTKYLFIIGNGVDVSRRVSVNYKGTALKALLDHVLTRHGYTYELEGHHIIVSVASRGDSQKAAPQRGSGRKSIIKGKVTDARTGEPIIGASVVVKGTRQGSITDFDGNFSLEAPAGSQLTVSYVGFNDQDITAEPGKVLSVSLNESSQALNEVVVVGYGVQRKADLTGSVANIKSEKLMDRPSTTVAQALEGRIAGVNVSSNSGRPGGRTNILIRGYSSINASSTPLYVVDGIIWEGGGLDAINPNDIESVDVLKDASSTAIYGTRGSNGVIIITTKKGRKGEKPTFSYDANFTVSMLARKIDMLNSEEFMKIWDTGYKNAQKFDPVGWASGKYAEYEPSYIREHYKVGNIYGNHELFDAEGKPLYDTDWQDVATRTSLSQSHNLSVTGGSEKTSYGLFLNYTDDEGILRTTYKKRFSARLNLDTKITNWLTVGAMFNYSDIREQFQDMEQGSGNMPRAMLETSPIIPERYPDGTVARLSDFKGLEVADTPTNLLDLRWQQKSALFTGNAYAVFKIINGLEFKTTVGVSNTDWREFIFSPTTVNLRSTFGRSRASLYTERRRFWQWENYLTYNTRINDIHSLNVMTGMELSKYHQLRYELDGKDLSDDFFSWNNLGQAKTQSIASSAFGWQMASFFARVNYALLNKYLVTVTGRSDGSSKFGKNNRYAFFPSAAAGWRMSEESFLASAKGWLSNLKLRLSYGVTGNSDIGEYRSLPILGSTTYVFGGNRTPGITIGELANPDLKWEKTTQLDIGIDVGLWDDRITLEADVFLKKTNNLLYETPVPSTSGKQSMMANIGSMENKGLELTLNTVNLKTRNFTWRTMFNISFLKNRITQLGVNNEDKLVDPDFLGKNVILRVGEPVGSFWGYKLLGTWGSDEADEAAKYGKKPGDLRHEDLNHDYQINDEDKQIIGKGTPDFYGSFNNYLTYKDFDLTFELQYSVGAKVLNNTNHSIEDRTSIANSKKTVLNAWTEENQNTPIAQTRLAAAGYTTLIDSHKVENGSFLRGKNLALGYNFPKKLISKWGFERIRVTISAQNFFLITSYSGYDPEVSTWDGGFSQNIQFFDYPKARSYSMGLNITF